jgi:hypothetical protein
MDAKTQFHMNYIIPLEKAEKTKKIGLIMYWRQKHYTALVKSSKTQVRLGYFKILETKLFQVKDDMHSVASARYRHYTLNKRASHENMLSEKIIILQDIIANINAVGILGYAKESFYSDANLGVFQKRLEKAKVSLIKQKENQDMQTYIAEQATIFFDNSYGKITLKEMHKMVIRGGSVLPCMRDEREKEEVAGIIKECCVGIFTNINSVKHLPVVLNKAFAKINKIISIKYNYDSNKCSKLISFIKTKPAMSILCEALRKQRKTNRNISYLHAAVILEKSVQFIKIRRTCYNAHTYRTLMLPRFYSYIAHLLKLFAQKILLTTRYTTMSDIMTIFPESISAKISSFITNESLPKEINVMLYY